MNTIYQQGICINTDQNDMFFSDRPDEMAQAQAVCFRCPVRINCLEAALDKNEEWGVWGGVIFWEGQPYYRRRTRGRPRKTDVGQPMEANREELWDLVRSA